MSGAKFFVALLIAAGVVFGAAWLIGNAYVFFAGYVVLQYIALATAWNILGGYTGYVNFGTAAFFALGAYTTVVLHKLTSLPLPIMMPIGGIVSGIVGLGTGYLTLRLRGAFFSIATLALAVVAQTLITNWDFVGGSRGAYIVRPLTVPLLGMDYIQYLFLVMLGLVVIVLATARAIERSRLGYGLATIRDDEVAAEASGVPTLRLKLVATTLSGAFMGMAGAPLPYYVTYLDPASGFNLAYAVNGVAMPLVGGTSSWLGPVIGAVLLGTLQQVVTVTISSAVNLLVVGLVLVAFVIVAPNRDFGTAAIARADRATEPMTSRTLALLEVHQSRQAITGGFIALQALRRMSNSAVRDGERVGLIGPNGSGKSTLVNCMCGTLRNETGSVRFAGHALDGLSAHERTRLGLARSFQLPRPFNTLTLAENLRIPLLYTVNARPGATLSAHAIDERCARTAANGRPRRQGHAIAARSHADRNAQARTGACDGGVAAPADRGRGDGRTVA